MKRVINLAAIATLTLFTACKTANKTPITLAGEWKVEQVTNQPVSGEIEPFIGFNEVEKRIYGSASCNRIMGGYQQDGNSLKFDKVALTRMMCADMHTEDAIVKAINATTQFSLSNDVLTLKDEAGNDMMRLIKKTVATQE